MKWVNKNWYYEAEGKYGSFKVYKNGYMWVGEYLGKTGKFFKLPARKYLKDAKELCQQNFWWE